MRALIERAGKWVFLSGLSGDFDELKAELEKAGSALELVARLDQYYADFDQVAPYQAARKKAFAPHEVAPSTSVVVKGLKRSIDLHVLAATAASGYRAERLSGGLNRPDTSGYSPCLRMGDMVFVAGQLARDTFGRIAAHGVAEETAYILRNRVVPALEASGSGLDLVLKAQAYISGHVSDFQNEWESAFGSDVPPTAVIPVQHPAFLSREATVEINVIAAHASARQRLRKEGPMRSLDGLVFSDGALPDGARTVRRLEFGSVVDVWGYAA
ncbi:MAG: RidA family protein [Betaproteobacteria bacterium]